MKVWSVIVMCVLIWSVPAQAKCVGKFPNPVTDICWSCIFPISIGSAKINAGGGRRDTKNPSSPVCLCPRPPLPAVPGISVGFWEPMALVDVTREPFCMVGMGGIQLNPGMKRKGGVGFTAPQNEVSAAKNSFYHVHWYQYPVLHLLNLLIDFGCMEQNDFDVAYMTELDPTWSDDSLAAILNPEVILFANPIAQGACIGDCTAATTHFPLDFMHWCAGCLGSIYPFSGYVSGHHGGVHASLLLVVRMAAKLHREFFLWETSDSHKAQCRKKARPVIKKSQYKVQMIYPVPARSGMLSCNPMGHSDVPLSTGQEVPIKGEDFTYLIWRKRNCCLL